MPVVGAERRSLEKLGGEFALGFVVLAALLQRSNEENTFSVLRLSVERKPPSQGRERHLRGQRPQLPPGAPPTPGAPALVPLSTPPPPLIGAGLQRSAPAPSLRVESGSPLRIMSALRRKFGDDYQVVTTSSSGSRLAAPGPGQGPQQQLVPKKKRQRFVDKERPVQCPTRQPGQ